MDIDARPAALVIKDAETIQLAEELAALRGVSVSEAVAEALQRQLAKRREVATRAARIMEAAAAVRATLTEPLPSSDHNWLYDENGIPV